MKECPVHFETSYAAAAALLVPSCCAHGWTVLCTATAVLRILLGHCCGGTTAMPSPLSTAQAVLHPRQYGSTAYPTTPCSS
jgi:hypothetical protein